jgi:DNA polymerase III epsilon subunit family exonuclease
MSHGFLSRARLAVLDLETSGAPPGRSGIVEIGLVEVEALRISDAWSSLVNPGCPISPMVTAIHGITDEDVRPAPLFEDLAEGLSRRLSQADAIVCHNAPFDMRFLQRALAAVNAPLIRRPVIDTLAASRAEWGRGGNSLGEVAGRLGVPERHHHRALTDAQVTADVVVAFACRLGEGFSLADFPGFIPDGSAFLEAARGGVGRAAVAAYGSVAINPVAADAAPQHGEVMRVLLHSAVRASREVGVICLVGGSGRVERRLVPRAIEGDLLVGWSLTRGEETRLRIEEIVEVRW